MIAVRVKPRSDPFGHEVEELVRLLETRLLSGNRPELQVAMNKSADLVAQAVRDQVRESETYYLPILKGLEPELGPRFRELSWEHEALASMADSLVADVREGRPQDALETLRRIAWALTEHAQHQGSVVSRFLDKEKSKGP